MLKVLAPIEAKSLEIVFSKAETTVKIPTKAVIPIAIIKTVRMVRSNCVLIEPKAIRIFSLNNFSIMTNLSRKYVFCYKFVFEVLLFILKSKIFADLISRKLESFKVERTNSLKKSRNKLIS
ncbi:hypothetical protein D3C72_1355250 [compost metagenome]